MPANSMYHTTHQHHVMYFLISCDFNLYLISCLPQHREDVQVEDVQFDPCFQYFVNSLSTISSVSQRHAVAEGEHLGSFTTRAAWFTQCCVRWTEATSAWATASHRTFPGWGEWGVIGRVWRLREMDFGMGKVDLWTCFSCWFPVFIVVYVAFNDFLNFTSFYLSRPQTFRSSAVRPRVLHDCLWHKQRNQRRQLPSRF